MEQRLGWGELYLIGRVVRSLRAGEGTQRDHCPVTALSKCHAADQHGMTLRSPSARTEHTEASQHSGPVPQATPRTHAETTHQQRYIFSIPLCRLGLPQALKAALPETELSKFELLLFSSYGDGCRYLKSAAGRPSGPV